MPVTPGTLPVAGHATVLAVEVDPAGAPGVFTTLPEVTSSIDWGGTRNKTEITPHGSNVDSHIVSQVQNRDDLTIEISYKFANTVHAALYGFWNANTIFGVMTIGPEGTAPGTDTIIESGQLTTFKKMGPVRNGEYKAQLVFRPSGPFKANGVIYS